VSGLSPRDLVRFRRNRIAMVFQSFALFPHKTVGENAGFGLTIEGLGRAERDERARHWLTRVGLEAYVDAYPAELSGGMRQRVGLARALAVDAPVLLMDEPFSALDPVTRNDLQGLVLELEAELQRTIVFVTHDFSEAERLAGRMAVLHEGRIAQTGTPAEIRTAPADAHVAAFVASAIA
jgi:glycine betaine/proline transport system ATP-binding protein